MQNAVLRLIRAIEAGDKVYPGVRQATQVLELVTAIFISSDKGQWINLPLEETYDDFEVY